MDTTEETYSAMSQTHAMRIEGRGANGDVGRHWSSEEREQKDTSPKWEDRAAARAPHMASISVPSSVGPMKAGRITDI